MAVTITDITPTGARQTKVYTVIADADSDTTATITHPFATDNPAMVARSLKTGISDAATAQAILKVDVLPLLGAANTSAWTVAFTDKDTLTLTKGTEAGSGAAGAQIRVRVELPHSLTA